MKKSSQRVRKFSRKGGVGDGSAAVALESFFCSETADRQPVPRAWARGEENSQHQKPFRSKKSLKAAKCNTIRPKCRCLESVQVAGLLQSSVVKAQIGLNIFLNISNDNVASYQTSLFVPHPKHALVSSPAPNCSHTEMQGAVWFAVLEVHEYHPPPN